MNTEANTTTTPTAATFKTTTTRSRVVAAALGSVCSLGLLFVVVSSMVGQSGGLPLGDFVAPQLADGHGTVVVAAPQPRVL